MAEEQGARALESLRGGVEEALQILGQGFVGHPKNTELREALRTGRLSLHDFHGELLRVVYRFIFLFVAEDRRLENLSLLHTRDASEAGRLARERYAAYYSTRRLRDMAAQIKGSRHGDLWRQIQMVVGALSGAGETATIRENLALPALGSLLWNPANTANLNAPTTGASGAVQTPKQARLLKDVQTDAPSKAGLFKRMYRGGASPRATINTKCLECVWMDEAAIRECTASECPLWGMRPYQRGGAV